MAVDRSFQPIADSSSRVLVLGSLPGKRSIAEQGYYAHPRNLFWSFLADITGVQASAEYEVRIAGLKRVGVALWDVAAQAERPGSLDSAIKGASVQYNPIPELLLSHPCIETILFNGATAQALFRRAERQWQADIRCKTVRLPSTSPANAGLALAHKRETWLIALTEALNP